MKNRVEPPILISRITTFVFAATLAIAGTLGITLYKMFPINHPQVFLLMSQANDTQTINLRELPPDSEYFGYYKRAFIREYVRARNEVTTISNIMQRKWKNAPDGVIRNWSTDEVYTSFQNTDMWEQVMNSATSLDITCPVEFHQDRIQERPDIAPNTYAVKFRYFCENSDGQIAQKDYTILVTLDLDNEKPIKWAERLDNPLGLHVSGYTIESGDGDPLNTGHKE